MTPRLARIWRHPIKGVGVEELDRVTLAAGRPLPFDRAWAVLEAGQPDAPGWRPCRDFIRGAKAASLMAVTARTVQSQTKTILHLHHPDRPDLTLDMSKADASARLISWLQPIYPADRPPPARLVPAPVEGMSDIGFASVAVLATASLAALSDAMGHPLDQRRFRGNLWLDGLAPFDEFDLVGRTLRIGTATLEVVEPITRCRATEANPETGHRDAPVLQALQRHFGHTDFGVYARVNAGGPVHVGDPVHRESTP